MKILKILGIFILIIIVVIAIILAVLKINHNSQLKKEAGEFKPLGELIDVNSKKVHVYTEGEGDITLVFLAGHGTSNPTLDFKPLWMRMVDEYRITVVERSGYGWSDVSNSPRDIDTMLNETRKALELSGEKGPYILIPHSMSGLKAIYWAQNYPDEVKAIIGLDPSIPEAIEVIPKPNKIQLYFMYLISRIGLFRFLPESEVGENLPLMKSDDLSDEDKEQYMAVFFRSAFTKDMLREIDYLKENAKTVADKETPVDIPMYFFISNVQDANVIGWKETLTNYISKITYGEFMQLDTGHYVHYDKAGIIADEAKRFITDLK